MPSSYCCSSTLRKRGSLNPYLNCTIWRNSLKGKVASVYHHQALTIGILLYSLGFVTSAAQAGYRDRCKAKSETQTGYSQFYSVSCNYLSGEELNERTKTFDYKSLTTYTVIFWDKGEATIIEPTGIYAFDTCGDTPADGCAGDAMGIIQGTDMRGLNWIVCTARSVTC